MSKKLSIIVPVYNMATEGKLNYCLDSLVGQTIRGLYDYEILCVLLQTILWRSCWIIRSVIRSWSVSFRTL